MSNRFRIDVEQLELTKKQEGLVHRQQLALQAASQNSTQTTLQGEKSAASKNDQDKPDLSLIPLEAEIAEARAFEVGERKYGRYNYYKGHKASQLVAALIRHAKAWMEGEENDPKDGQPHLGSVRACAAMIIKQQALGTLKDDRPPKTEKK